LTVVVECSELCWDELGIEVLVGVPALMQLVPDAELSRIVEWRQQCVGGRAGPSRAC
jgi:uncharacterized Fe-S cluster-containing radical SAM superfamily enzyme